MEGWKGGADGSKVMVFEVDMPHCGSEGFSECDWDRPSVWALNSKVRQNHTHLYTLPGLAFCVHPRHANLRRYIVPDMTCHLGKRVLEFGDFDYFLIVPRLSTPSLESASLITVQNPAPRTAGLAYRAVRMQLPGPRWQRRVRRIRHRGSSHRQRPLGHVVHDGLRLQGDRISWGGQVLPEAIGENENALSIVLRVGVKPWVASASPSLAHRTEMGCPFVWRTSNKMCGAPVMQAASSSLHVNLSGHPRFFSFFLTTAPQAPTTYAAVFRGGDDAYLQVVQLADFDFSQTSLSGSFLDSLKMASTENHDIYNVAGPSASKLST